MSKKRVLLAFSGGLDTSAIVPWLRETENAEVIAYCADLGNAPDYNFLQNRAKELGAVEFIFEDLRDHFVTNFVYPSIRAGATYQDDYLLGTAIGRPLIAERMAHYARTLGAQAVAHGATGKGNDQLRFEKSLAFLVPDLRIIAPWKTWDFKGRQDLMNYLTTKGYSVNAKTNLYSEDVNLLHRSCEGGILEAVGNEYDPKEIYQWVATAQNQTPEARKLTLSFEGGIPIALDGKVMSPSQLLGELNTIAGAAGIGIVDLVEERVIGIKSRGIYETPGGTLLHLATRNLKHLCWDRPLLAMARSIGGQYGELIYDGLWHSEARDAAEAFFQKASHTLIGNIGLCVEAGRVRITERTSPCALYDEKSVTFETDEHNFHHLADGYSRITRFSQWRAGQRHLKNAARTIAEVIVEPSEVSSMREVKPNVAKRTRKSDKLIAVR